MRPYALFLVVVVVAISGCLSASSPYCRALEKDLREAGKNCECVSLDETPESLGNYAETVQPKCRCTCNVNGTITAVDVLESRSVE